MAKQRCPKFENCFSCTSGGCVWLQGGDFAHCRSPIDISGGVLDIVGPLNTDRCVYFTSSASPSHLVESSTPAYIGKILHDQETLSSLQDIMAVVLVILVKVLIGLFVKKQCRKRRETRRQQRSPTPRRDRSHSPPRDRNIRDFIGMPITRDLTPVQHHYATPEPLTPHHYATPAPPTPARNATPIQPAINAVIHPPVIQREGSIVPVYENQVVIISRDDLQEQQQQHEPDIDQRSFISDSSYGDVEGSFNESNVELLRYDTVEYNSVVDSRKRKEVHINIH